jgi:RNA polymerase sigma factor (sigma-70 family)
VSVRDPLRNPAPLIRRVYAYAAYRVGDGPDAEDVTSETFERALRYRESFDARRGTPAAWLVGIARRCADDHLRGRGIEVPTDDEELLDSPGDPSPADIYVQRLDLAAAVATLNARDRELIALRYGADLKAKDIAALLGQKTNTVEMALHRALERLRTVLEPGNLAPGHSKEHVQRGRGYASSQERA